MVPPVPTPANFEAGIDFKLQQQQQRSHLRSTFGTRYLIVSLCIFIHSMTQRLQMGMKRWQSTGRAPKADSIQELLTCHKEVDGAICVPPHLRPRGLVVDLGIGFALKLLQHVGPLYPADDLLCLLDRARHALPIWMQSATHSIST